ncbi:MAG: glycosyltransferase family 4 protein [Flavobacteriaceae bacterium]|jgi:glycosyltransferase involved in cell wall biosynthesis|nr:glycosyltransferase family 4 protein [Flavobacteriaceae bacterium]
MKVLFIARATLYSSWGGDTVQIEKTAENLRKLGVHVDIGLTNDTFDYDFYDIIHFFNIIRPSDIIYHAKKARKYVISTIFVDYEEYERKQGTLLKKIFRKFFGKNNLEYLKTIARALLNGEKIKSKEYLFWGHEKSVKKVIKNAAALLPNSENEAKRLEKTFGKINIPVFKITNGIEIIPDIEPNEKFKDSIICIGRIEGRKNQLNLIKAANALPYKFYIIGQHSPNHKNYYKICRRIAKSNIEFIEHLPQKEIFSIMKSAKVHALVSWFETTGLVSLEAAYYGCNIVVSDKGDQKEYIEDNGFFCDTASVDSICQAIKKAHQAPFNQSFKNYIAENYTWEKAAEQTLAVYKTVL